MTHIREVGTTHVREVVSTMRKTRIAKLAAATVSLRARVTGRRQVLLRASLVAIAAVLANTGVAVTAEAPPAAATTCSVTVGGKTGAYICGTYLGRLGWSIGGRSYTRVFVVGLDRAVWNIYVISEGGSYTYISGWQSLGGYAKEGVWAYYGDVIHVPDSVLLRVIGSDNQMYCKRLLPAPPRWTGWSTRYC